MNYCKRCGQSIKNVYLYQGELYGEDCVRTVSDLPSWEIRASKGNLDAYKERQAVIMSNQKEKEDSRLRFTEKNYWLIDFLSNFDNSSFAKSMVDKLSVSDIEDLPEKAYEAIRSMWSSNLTGLERGLAEVEFTFATSAEDINNIETVLNAKEYAMSFATLREIRTLLKNNGVTGVSKLSREESELKLIDFLEI